MIDNNIIMNSIQTLDLHGPAVVPRECKNTSPFPIITRKDKNKRSILVQRSVSSVVTRDNVPAPEHEYDFRRTPDPGRATPRKNFHGHIRPYIPPDTAEVEGQRLAADDLPVAPFNYKTHLLHRLDVTRCPTPMPSDNNAPDETLYYSNGENPRTAWTSNTKTISNNAPERGEKKSNETPRCHTTAAGTTRPSSRHRRTIPSSNVPDREMTTPTPSLPMDLTETVLNYYYNQNPADKDKRIMRWIVDCEEKSKNLLPAHLPNISVKSTGSLEES